MHTPGHAQVEFFTLGGKSLLASSDQTGDNTGMLLGTFWELARKKMMGEGSKEEPEFWGGKPFVRLDLNRCVVLGDVFLGVWGGCK